MTDDELARQLAAEVLAGDTAASYAICDLLLDVRASGRPLAEVGMEKFPRVAAYMVEFQKAKKNDKPNSLRECHQQIKRWSVEEKVCLRAAMATHQPIESGSDGRWPRWFGIYLGELWQHWEPQIGSYAAKILGWSGYVTPAAVAANEMTIRAISGFGHGTEKKIRAMLARYGMQWK